MKIHKTLPMPHGISGRIMLTTPQMVDYVIDDRAGWTYGEKFTLSLWNVNSNGLPYWLVKIKGGGLTLFPDVIYHTSVPLVSIYYDADQRHKEGVRSSIGLEGLNSDPRAGDDIKINYLLDDQLVQEDLNEQ